MSTMQENVYQQLKKHIQEGRWKSGEKLGEIKIANELGVSRNPIREALLRLASEGLVERQPGIGCQVAVFDLDTLIRLYQLREALEGMASRLAAKNMDTMTLFRIKQEAELLAELSKEGKHDESFEKNENNFHRLIIEASKNPLLYDVWKDQRVRVFAIRKVFLPEDVRNRIQKRDPNIMIESHKKILDALERKDPNKAEEYARQHIRRALEDTLQLYNEIKEEKT